MVSRLLDTYMCCMMYCFDFILAIVFLFCFLGKLLLKVRKNGDELTALYSTQISNWYLPSLKMITNVSCLSRSQFVKTN